MPHAPTRADTMAVIDTHWADSLGCDLRQLHPPGVSIVRNAGRLADSSGSYLLRWGKTCLFSVSERFFERAACQARERVPDEVFDPGFLASLFDDHVERIIGPA